MKTTNEMQLISVSMLVPHQKESDAKNFRKGKRKNAQNHTAGRISGVSDGVLILPRLEKAPPF